MNDNIEIISIDDIDETEKNEDFLNSSIFNEDDFTLLNDNNSNINFKKINPIIGTLKEKSLHSYLKNYYEFDKLFHEKKIPNSHYVADIYKNGRIIEIQTGSFGKMREKLKEYYSNSIPVKIVYPLKIIKYISYLNKKTGELTNKRKSPKNEKLFDVFNELIYLKETINSTFLSFDIVLCEVEEIRLLNKDNKKFKRQNYSKVDTIPLKIEKIIEINSLFDFFDFFNNISEVEKIKNGDDFTIKTLAQLSGTNLILARKICYVFKKANLIEFNGKKGRENLYKIKANQKSI